MDVQTLHNYNMKMSGTEKWLPNVAAIVIQ